MRFIKKNWFIIILIIFASFLRFYKLSDWFFFNIDEDCYHFLVKKIVFDKRPVLVGCWEIPGGLPIPPVVYYFGALLMFIFSNNPLGMAFNASFWGVVGVYLIYQVGKKVFRSLKIAVFSSIIYAFSYLVNIYNRLTLTIYLGPILALLTYFSLTKLIREGKKRWLIILALVFVFATQEGSLISLIILSLTAFVIFKHKLRGNDFFILFLALILTFLPLIIFDLRHEFLLSQKFINFFNFDKNYSINLFAIIPYFKLMFTSFSRIVIPTGPNDLNIQILPCRDYLTIINNQTSSIYHLLGLFLTILFIFLKKNLWEGKLIFLHLLIVSFGLIFYSLVNPGHLYEWFFVVLFPAFCLITASLLDFLSRFKIGRFLVVSFFILFLWINIRFILTGTAAVGYKDKIAAVRYAINIAGNKKFSVEMLGNRCNGYGYRYFFTYLEKEPVKSYMDYQYAGWLYPKNQEKEIQSRIVLVPLVDLDTEDLRKEHDRLKKEAVQSKRFNNLEVLLIGN